MHTVRSILRRKGAEILSVRPEGTVLEAIRLMAEKRIGALLVLDGDGRLVGIVSERDYARKVILEGRRSDTTRVADIMTPNPITIDPDTTAEEGLNLMTDRFIRHLPVLDNGKLVGVVSIGDLVKWVIRDQKLAIDELERYVTGSA